MNKSGIGAMFLITAALSICGCQKKEAARLTESGLDPANFSSVFKGDSTCLVTIANANGMEVCITNFGGRIVSLMVPDKNGIKQDVVLGFDSVSKYFPENNLTDFGASIGRYANRINQGRFILDGDTIQLPQNNFGHCLHGGAETGDLGWQYHVYKVAEKTDSTLLLTLDSRDGENGFPGNVKANVLFTVTSDNALKIEYSAVTDKPTVINMTNHSYFNLSGDPELSVNDETLCLKSTTFTPVDSTYMTTGEILPVKDTPMDFTVEKLIGKDIESDYIQIKYANGYDHNFILDTEGNVNEVAATLSDPRSGIVMDLYTNEPGLQVYTGNFLDGTIKGKKAKIYNRRNGICLETQKYPDSPNKPQWPLAVLRPGETYNSVCIFKFRVNK